MNALKKALAALQSNKDAVIRRSLIAAGAVGGMLITSTLVDRLGDRRTVIGSTDLDLHEDLDSDTTASAE